MKAGSGFIRFLGCRPVWGAMAVSFLACSITLQGAPPSSRGAGRGESLNAAVINNGRSIPVSAIPPGVGVRALTPEVALREMGDAFLIGTGDAGDVVTATGGPTGCELDDECDDCNSCTEDACDQVTGNCVFTEVVECTTCNDGLFCNGTEKCDGLDCLVAETIKEFTCIAGDTNAGLACFDATDPVPVCDVVANCQLQSVNTDPCRFFPDLLCDELETTGVNQTGACVNFCDLADPTACDDDIGCNGLETCVGLGTVGNGGFCLGDTTTPGQVCVTAGDCGGVAPICGGVCREAPERFCGSPWASYNVGCNEAEPDPDCTLSFGRCCTPNGNDFDCTRNDKVTCRTGGGFWLGVGDEVQTPLDDGADPPDSTNCLAEADSTALLPGDTFLCPKYSAAITTGTIDGVIGLAGAAACNGLWEIGDDYTMPNCKGVDPGDPNDSANSWYEVLSLRWIGGHVRSFGSRMRVTFYDINGTFIEDRITSFAFPGGISRNTVVFDQKPIIPCTGFMTIKPAVSFSPDNKVQWAFTTGSPQVGTTDANIYGRKHGTCNANPGTTCSVDTDCPVADTCNVTSSVTSIDGAAEKVAPLEIIGTGTLAFEIAGRKVPKPVGACCSLDTGVCTPELPWICEELGNFFQGSGTKCNICSNNLFLSCDATVPPGADCFTCSEGSDNEFDLCGCPDGSCNGTVCVLGGRDGLECTCPGGFCETTAFCLPSPPACQITACCSDTDGSCVQVTGNSCVDLNGVPTAQGACATDAECNLVGTDFCRIASGNCSAGSDNPDAFCVGDAECPNGECLAPCPNGTTPLGFGTKCRPNCCVQTIDTAADTCDEAPIVVLNVPALGQPPISFTWTSNNKAATFGDRVEGVGPDDPPTGTCTSVIFSEVGGFRDRGWWHAFSIDACADIRIDHCCTFEIDGRIHQPAWAQIWLDCNPCTTAIGGSILGVGSFPADPIGDPTRPNARGGPFCNFDDLWTTYGPLEKGIYRYATYSGSGGHFGVFQLHVTVGACVKAVCCLEEGLCVQKLDNGTPGPFDGLGCQVNDNCAPTAADQVCVDDDLRPNKLCCPGGACDNDLQDPRCVDGSRDTLPCCQGGGTCKGNCPAGCQVLLETECDALGGFWHGFGSIPLGDPPVLSCDTDVCLLGSCCIGPGVCQEDLDPDCVSPNCCADNDQFCMNKKDCLGTNGLFVGGARCEFQKNPCPACQIEGTNNCHNLDGVNFAAPSDISMKPGGFLKADDIVLEGPQVSEVCVWGAYFDGLNGPLSNHSCSGLVEDDFRVRFYADDGTGRPDHTALIAQAGGNPNVVAEVYPGAVHVGAVTVFKSDTPDQSGTPEPENEFALEVFTLQFPVMNIPTGVTVWLEVANNTDTSAGAEDPSFNTCDWWWAQSQNIFVNSTGTGNEWSYAGTDFRPIDYPTDLAFNNSYEKRPGLTGFLQQGGDWTDQVFCLAGPTGPTNFTDPDPPTGSCCDCDDVFDDNQTLAQCTDRDGQHEKRWKRGSVGTQSCLPPMGVPGDDCGPAAAGTVASTIDCSAPAPGPGEAVIIFDGGFEAQSVCAGDTLDECFPGECLGGDFWTNYVTTCTGELVMSMCHTGIFYGNFDSFLAVYHDTGDPTNCPCPSSSLDRLVLRSDEGCNGEPDGGSGVVQGRIVFPGECWTIRLGGWGMTLATAARGTERLDVGCIARSCFPSATPTLQTQFGTVANAGLPELKNRVIAINAGDAGQEQKVRVKWDAQPNWVPGQGHGQLVGQVKWMTAPFQVCENSGDGLETSPPNCGISPGQPQRWYWAANLTCDETSAYIADLTKLTDFCARTGEECQSNGDCALGTCGVDGVIHLIDSGIAPSKNLNQQAIYSVQVLELACSSSVEDNFSLPLVVTQPVWGDIGDAADCPVLPPEGVAKLVTDVTNALAKFSNAFCAPKKTRVDVDGQNLNFRADILDVVQLLNAFGTGSTVYSFPAGPACAPPSAKVAQGRRIRNR